jgi:hypothetical protein
MCSGAQITSQARNWKTIETNIASLSSNPRKRARACLKFLHFALHLRYRGDDEFANPLYVIDVSAKNKYRLRRRARMLLTRRDAVINRHSTAFCHDVQAKS